MKPYSLNIKIRNIITVLLCCVLLLVEIPVNGQINCSSDSTPLIDTEQTSRIRWALYATVQVNINSNQGQFNQSEYNNCIKPVFDNFNEANAQESPGIGNFSRVYFSTTFSSNTVATITSSQVSRNESGILRGFQINKGSLDDLTGGITYFGDNGTDLNSATTIINAQATNKCTALKHIVAHEIGHTMALIIFVGIW